jgi:hypothetical protein
MFRNTTYKALPMAIIKQEGEFGALQLFGMFSAH